MPSRPERDHSRNKRLNQTGMPSKPPILANTGGANGHHESELKRNDVFNSDSDSQGEPACQLDRREKLLAERGKAAKADEKEKIELISAVSRIKRILKKDY